MPLFSPKTYHHIKQDPEEEKEPFFFSKEEGLENSLHPQRADWWSSLLISLRNPTIPWLLVCFLLLSNVALYITYSSSHEVPWTPTDLVFARDVIKNKPVKFSSGLNFTNNHGHLLRISDPDEPVYIGNDSNVDANWDKLIMPDYTAVKISPEERKLVDNDIDMYLFPDNTYTIALSVFHDLHCLNTIRKRIYADMYPEMYPEMLKPNAIIHVDHCIEAMREMIMCRGDMTPIPVIWDEHGERDNPWFPIVHSCRDFSQLREWMLKRHDLY